MPGTEDKSRIVIRNIYYMLSYSFRGLDRPQYREIATEPFENVENLFAAILAKGVAQQIKQGLYREYIGKSEMLPVIRGKLDLPGTIRNRIRREPKAACEFDELTEDNLLNRILKTGMNVLVRSRKVEPKWKAALKENLVFFDGVGELTSFGIPRGRIQYQRNNLHYEMLVNLCFLLLDKQLQTTDKGKKRLATFSDEDLARLYERFVYEYYRQEHPELSARFQTQVKWDLSVETERTHLPAMNTDTVLQKGEKTLVIDTKFYGHILKSSRIDSQKKLPSANLYQIFAYVKNMDAGATGNVSGLLLYAKTNELEAPECDFNMSGNWIHVRTLDLNLDFSEIRNQLDKIAEECFSPELSGL